MLGCVPAAAIAGSLETLPLPLRVPVATAGDFVAALGPVGAVGGVVFAGAEGSSLDSDAVVAPSFWTGAGDALSESLPVSFEVSFLPFCLAPPPLLLFSFFSPPWPRLDFVGAEGVAPCVPGADGIVAAELSAADWGFVEGGRL